VRKLFTKENALINLTLSIGSTGKFMDNYEFFIASIWFLLVYGTHLPEDTMGLKKLFH